MVDLLLGESYEQNSKQDVKPEIDSGKYAKHVHHATSGIKPNQDRAHRQKQSNAGDQWHPSGRDAGYDWKTKHEKEAYE